MFQSMFHYSVQRQAVNGNSYSFFNFYFFKFYFFKFCFLNFFSFHYVILLPKQ